MSTNGKTALQIRPHFTIIDSIRKQKKAPRAESIRKQPAGELPTESEAREDSAMVDASGFRLTDPGSMK